MKKLHVVKIPYHSLTMNVTETADNGRGSFTVRGVVVAGTERSRLFQHVSYRDISGRPFTVYGVTQAELDAGKHVGTYPV